ncbi:MAG TPA: Ig-like domain-containing protein, partial [Gammaproteobacteria bacterium]|nr:Ig-like domain-containing protein [Gammaproteobacteria bacterium]
MIQGVAANNRTGQSVSNGGDVNGDGVDDLVIGSDYTPGNADGEGSAYVVLGGAVGSGSRFELSALNGGNGFRIDVPVGHQEYAPIYVGFGQSVNVAGDVDGDGFDDIIIAATLDADDRSGYSGAAFVTFGGKHPFPADFESPPYSGVRGLRLAGEYSNTIGPVSDAGDINGDGFDDLIIGSPLIVTNPAPGKVYVVFGGHDVGGSGYGALSAFNGSNGFMIELGEEGDGLGSAISAAGDVNGDGFDDIIVTTRSYGARTGKTYVLFGGPGVGSTGHVDLSSLDGSNGFFIEGSNPDEPFSVSTGDVNGDGVADILIGGDPFTEADHAGAAYVIFGGPKVGCYGSVSLSSLDGSNGFVLLGSPSDEVGFSAAAGDINGDGVADLILPAPGDQSETGKSYVVFGKSKIGSNGSFTLSSLDGRNGFVIENIPSSDRIVTVDASGDVNGDGVKDIAIGAPSASPHGDLSGAVYLLYGEAAGANTDHAPVASDGSLSVSENTAGQGTLKATDADGDKLTYSKVGDPAHGTVKVKSDGSYTYTPASGYAGNDSFTFKANDGICDSDTSMVKITVSSQAPAASNGTVAPSNGTAAPSNGTAAPSSGTAAPSNGTAAPSNGTAAPSNGTGGAADQ